MEECNMCYEKVTVIKSICEQMDHRICTKCASQIYSTRHKLFCEYCQKQFNDNIEISLKNLIYFLIQ